MLIVRFCGYWTLDTCTDFEKALKREITKFPKAPSVAPNLLVDSHQHPVQSQEVMHRLGQSVEMTKNDFSRRAIVVSGAVHQLQAKRLNAQLDHRVFTNMDEALRWLS
jgi:hypothetical protein